MKFGRHVEFITLNIFASYFDYLSLIVFKITNFKGRKRWNLTENPTLKNSNSFKNHLICMKFGRHIEFITLNIFASYFDYLSLIVFKITNFKGWKRWNLTENPTLKNRNSFKSNPICMKFGRHVEFITLNTFASYFDYLSLIVFKITNFKGRKRWNLT